MPPKAASSGNGNVTLSGKNVMVLRKLLCSLDTKVNYTTIGRAIGLNTPNNGRVAVKNAIAQLGVTVKDGSFHALVDEDAAAAAATGPPAKGKEANKRKRETEDPDDDTAKKSKKAPTGGAGEDAQDEAEEAEGADSST